VSFGCFGSTIAADLLSLVAIFAIVSAAAADCLFYLFLRFIPVSLTVVSLEAVADHHCRLLLWADHHCRLFLLVGNFAVLGSLSLQSTPAI
jgi:hypothetical protein